jgi:hypothetical protein
MLRQASYKKLQPDVFATQLGGYTPFDISTVLNAVRDRQPDLFDGSVDDTGMCASSAFALHAEQFFRA